MWLPDRRRRSYKVLMLDLQPPRGHCDCDRAAGRFEGILPAQDQERMMHVCTWHTVGIARSCSSCKPDGRMDSINSIINCFPLPPLPHHNSIAASWCLCCCLPVYSSAGVYGCCNDITGLTWSGVALSPTSSHLACCSLDSSAGGILSGDAMIHVLDDWSWVSYMLI